MFGVGATEMLFLLVTIPIAYALIRRVHAKQATREFLKEFIPVEAAALLAGMILLVTAYLYVRSG